jgi:hypothetical protein
VVNTGEQTFHLQFTSDVPKEKPGQFKGARVIVTGTRVDDQAILVTGLRRVLEK